MPFEGKDIAFGKRFTKSVHAMTVEEIEKLFEKYDFLDPYGRSLTRCIHFMQLVFRAGRVEPVVYPGKKTKRKPI